MGLTWTDISLFTILFGLVAALMARGVAYLNNRNAQEVRQNRQAMCARHQWERHDSGELICRLCGKIPG